MKSVLGVKCVTFQWFTSEHLYILDEIDNHQDQIITFKFQGYE